ncbi:MAG: hypothetical protein AB7E26_09945 [Chryseobacterium sp.]
MNIIENFIKQYEKEYDFYIQISQLANDILDSGITKRGIKAIISHRAKKPDRLKIKLLQRNEKKKYNSKKSIEKDIVDLAGVRVAMYFPSERQIVEDAIKDLFEVKEIKNFPVESHEPHFNKRFSGYWATHYRVTLKKSDEIDSRFISTVFEIQVASVLMHAWSEVEHDLIYKPLSGNLSNEELSILDEINGLVLIGEIALERLKKAITQRTENQIEITDKYDLTNFVLSNYREKFGNINLGNTEYLNNYLKAIHKIDTSQIKEAFQKVNLNINESFSDQVLQNIISINYDSKNLNKYFSKITQDENKISFFELFIKAWILFEKTITQIASENNVQNNVNLFSKSEVLKEMLNFSKKDVEKISFLRKMRNDILHGVGSFTDEELELGYNNLFDILQNNIDKIMDNNFKNELSKELANLELNH